MHRRRLGHSGLEISRLGLGTMNWGRDIDEVAAQDLLESFHSAGGNLVDTADVYAEGVAEEMLGHTMSRLSCRDDLVLVTKTGSRPGASRRFDASRIHLLGGLDQSLRRLGTDRVDVWMMHGWDPLTPIDETVAAMDVAVASGRARYAGISNYSGWQLATAAGISGGYPQVSLIAAEHEYSLLQRGIEREVLPATKYHGLGVLAWSPLGRGVLTGKYRRTMPAGSRAASPTYSNYVRPYLVDALRPIVDATATAADGMGVSPAQISLAWVRDRPGVAAAIVGARSVEQLNTLLGSELVTLPAQIAEALDEVSAPQRGYPDFGWNQVPDSPD